MFWVLAKIGERKAEIGAPNKKKLILYLLVKKTQFSYLPLKIVGFGLKNFLSCKEIIRAYTKSL